MPLGSSPSFCGLRVNCVCLSALFICSCVPALWAGLPLPPSGLSASRACSCPSSCFGPLTRFFPPLWPASFARFFSSFASVASVPLLAPSTCVFALGVSAFLLPPSARLYPPGLRHVVPFVRLRSFLCLVIGRWRLSSAPWLAPLLFRSALPRSALVFAVSCFPPFRSAFVLRLFFLLLFPWPSVLPFPSSTLGPAIARFRPSLPVPPWPGSLPCLPPSCPVSVFLLFFRLFCARPIDVCHVLLCSSSVLPFLLLPSPFFAVLPFVWWRLRHCGLLLFFAFVPRPASAPLLVCAPSSCLFRSLRLSAGCGGAVLFFRLAAACSPSF